MGRRIAVLVCAAPALMASAAFAAEPRVMHRFLELAMSPDGRNVASVEGDSSPWGGEPVVRALVIRTTEGKRSTNVALPCGAVPQCWPSSPVWTADGKALAFALRKPGTHARSIYTVESDGSGLKDIFDFDGTIIDLKYGPGGRLAMLAIAGANKEVGATQAGAPIMGDLGVPVREQRIAILDGGKLDWSTPDDLFVYEYDWLPDGSGFVGTAAKGNGDNNWWVAKLYRFARNGAAPTVIFTPPDIRHQIADPVVSRDGKTVAFISGIMSDFGSNGGDVYTLPVEGGPATNLTPNAPLSARSLVWSCDGKLRAQVLADATTMFLEFRGGAGFDHNPVLYSTSDSLRTDGPGVSLGCPSGAIATAHESYTQPPEIEVGGIGKWHDLTHVNAGLTAPATARSITWKNDGFDIQGWLLLPLHTKGKLPLITIVHGGPASAAVPGFLQSGTDRALLEKGYALFHPNPRGSFGQGEAFAAANVRDLGHGDLRDILAGIDAVEKLAPIDDARLGIDGGSYGGFMTMWAVTQTHRFKAGVAAAGISDWLSYYGENGIDEWMIPYFGKSAYDDPEVYARSSAINYIHNVTTPVFSYVGADDIECPAPQTQEFWHALHDLGVPTSYAIYPGEGHGLRDPAHIADAEARTLAWFDRYLR